MEGNRRRMNAGEALRPDLWSNLPDVLVDLIIKKVLIDLPFSKLERFCRFCKRWRDFILSSTHYLVYFHMGELKAFNSSRGSWETISLQFCQDQVEGLTGLQNLQLVSSCGGLLCLSSNVHGEYIVCNPLTKCCKWLRRRWIWRPTQPVLRDQFGTRVVAQSTWPAKNTMGSMRPQEPEVLVYYSDIAGDFQLMLSNGLRYRRRGIVHRYRRAGWPVWQIVAGVNDGFSFFINRPWMKSPVLIALGFYRATRGSGFTVLVYNIKQKRCRWITTSQIPLNTKRSGRKELVVGTVVQNQLEFREIGDTGHTVAFPPTLRSVFELLMRKISEDLRAAIVDTSKVFKMVYVEQDDHIVYHVAMVTSSATGPFDVIAVWRHSRVDKTDVISEWSPEEWRSQVGQWPSSTCFHVFKPSFTCASCGDE